jgi:hypothetical protein
MKNIVLILAKNGLGYVLGNFLQTHLVTLLLRSKKSILGKKLRVLVIVPTSHSLHFVGTRKVTFFPAFDWIRFYVAKTTLGM